jgi:hypothetical protein
MKLSRFCHEAIIDCPVKLASSSVSWNPQSEMTVLHVLVLTMHWVRSSHFMFFFRERDSVRTCMLGHGDASGGRAMAVPIRSLQGKVRTLCEVVLLLGVLKPLSIGYCDDGVRKEDWCSRKRGPQAIRAHQGDLTGVTCARQCQSFSRMQALCFHVFRESAPLFTTTCFCVMNALHCMQLIVQASCGHDFTLLLDANGCVFSFGGNEHGQLGHGDSAQRDTPRIVQTLSGNRVRMVAAGMFARWDLLFVAGSSTICTCTA